MFLTAAAILPLVGMVGSGVDIGRAYMAELRLQQACDAGALAGRRAMTGSVYSNDAKAEANKMFAFNFPSGNYGTSNITFSSTAISTSDVRGTASAKLPTALMKVFNFTEFDLSVACTAKLEISNTDVMMVLDTTGSMSGTNSGDAQSKIQGLRAASLDFFDTLTTAAVGDGRIRFGVVPYSSTVNVGAILAERNPAWIADQVELPSREPIMKDVFGNPTTVAGDDYTDTAPTFAGWSNHGTGSASSSAACLALTVPADDSYAASGSPTSTQAGQYVDGAGNRITTFAISQKYTFYNYRYSWGSNSCRLQRRLGTFYRVSENTRTEYPVPTFDNAYRYKNRTFDVFSMKTGGSITENTGTAGANVTVTWGGCIMERDTRAFSATQTAPADALDMNIDMEPTSNPNTQWKMLLPLISFSRNSPPEYVSSANSQNFVQRGGDYAACPSPAMKLTTMTTADRGAFAAYINSLQPRGYTLHDSGMVWGARLLSPDGLFADENATAPNNRPIGRHIIFMTDGDMTAPRINLSFQGNESAIVRTGGTSDADNVNRHNNRFVQLCTAAKAKNITVWVVGFGTALNAQLLACASPGKAYRANNSAQLNEQFQAIARQISKLRLSQ